MQFRIGRRDPETGLYYVIHPDGSELLNGIKIFNAAYTVGDSVLATQRSDGMMILDGVNAVEDVPSPSPFNDEEEELPRITITLAPNSPPAAKPLGQTTYPQFNGPARIALIVRFTLDRPFRRELLVDISLKDDDVSDPSYVISMIEFESNKYLIVYLSSEESEPVKYSAKVKIPANSKFIDVNFTPSLVSSRYGRTSYAPLLKSTFAVPKARSIKADLTLPFKCANALIYKVVESNIVLGGGSREYPQLLTSDDDISSLPYMLGIGAEANTSQLTFLDFNSFPQASPPYRQVVFITLNNPDTAPDAWGLVRYLEFILPNLLARTPSINKRYIYVIESRRTFHFEPPRAYPDFRDRSWRHTVSAEISGSSGYGYTPRSSVLQFNEDISSRLIAPYYRPKTQHLGYVESTWLSRSISNNLSGQNSETFYQSCLKIDTEDPSQSKFIPCTASRGSVVNPNPETFYLP